MTRTYTLCTYEAPEARHMIEDWRKAPNTPPIKSWDGTEDTQCEVVTFADKGEVMYIIPVRFDALEDFDATVLALQARKLTFKKHIHFGKVPTRNIVFMNLVGGALGIEPDGAKGKDAWGNKNNS